MKFRPLRLALVLGVLGAATVVIPAAPAFAALSLYRVTNTSTSDDSSPKSVSISCNSGDSLVGLGGRINDGGGEVLLTKMYANSALNTATVQGVEAQAVSTAWSATVYAVCAPAGTVGGLELDTSPVASNAGDKINVAASCTGSKVVLGGGFKLESAGGGAAMDELKIISGVQTVYSTAYVHDPAAGNFTLTTQAICANKPAHSDYVFQSPGPYNSISPKTETTSVCPTSGNQPTFVGGVLDGLAGSGSLVALEPHLSEAANEVTGREIGSYTGTWNLTAQMICIG
jgi:hypothetical protein